MELEKNPMPANSPTDQPSCEDAPRTLAIMTKYWNAGRVKTRLAQSLMTRPECLSRWVDPSAPLARPDSGTQCQRISARLHERFVRELLDELGRCGDRRELVGAPLDDLPRLAATAGPNWTVVNQGDGDLGDRMQRWFLPNVAMGCPGQTGRPEPLQRNQPTGAVMIGSDCPLLTCADLHHTWESLCEHDIVLGPAVDGGYYLIGIAGGQADREIEALFNGIAWSTETVFEQTIEIVERLGWRCSVLPERRDVDTVEDLAALLADDKILGPEDDAPNDNHTGESPGKSPGDRDLGFQVAHNGGFAESNRSRERFRNDLISILNS